MICSKCGQELKDGVKFCTKCGTNFKETANLQLPIVSFALSAIGIIGYWIMRFSINKLYQSGNYSSAGKYWAIANCFEIIIYLSIIVALLALKKQKSLLAFISGLIPPAYFIVMEAYYILRNLAS